MTIHCKVCGLSIKSTSGIAPEGKVMEMMANHLVNCHRKDAVSLKQDIDSLYMLLSTYLLMRDYVSIPDDEPELLETYRAAESAISELFQPQPAAYSLQMSSVKKKPGVIGWSKDPSI